MIFEGKKISRDLIEKVLISMMLAEYRLDALLLHPPSMRFREIEEICVALGLDRHTLLRIVENWHEGIRQRIFPELSA